MARIKINDLSEDTPISEDEMRRLKGGPRRRTHDHTGDFGFKSLGDRTEVSFGRFARRVGPVFPKIE